ncbi:MAG TPA: acyltransferase [Phycisphaeraceae bacterium]|nr:acyltransferase [Phycisphaeraceae bacterium]
MKYYKEIDGLRALAVLAVILYHLDFSFVPGGFVGVDIFFVISGFLITGSIRSDIEAGSFTIPNFYRRRIRRIIPALFFVVMAVIPFAYYILLPEDFAEFLKSVFSVSTFTSNIFFWKYSDYFSVASELKPLLHTWSLGIEEQFYIVFPVFMLLTRKMADRNAALLLAVFAIASFVMSLPSIGLSDAVATFYLPFTRFWELLAGALLAVTFHKIPRKGVVLDNLLSLVGLALVIASIALLDRNGVFSGLTVLYTVLGTVLIIYAARGGTLLSVVLTNRLVVYTGLISYSLYLWHWPIIALVKSSTTGELGLWMQLSILGLAFVLSAFSYTFVEQPFRREQKLREFLQIKAGIAALAFLSVISGSALYAMGPVETGQEDVYDQLCFYKGKETLKSTERCSFGTLNTERIFLLYGDSHSNALFPAFQKFASENGYRGIVARSGGCAPVFGVFRLDGVGADGCTGTFSENVRAFLHENKDSIDMVYMVSRWTLYQTGWIMDGRLQKATHYLSDSETTSVLPSDSARVLKRALLRTVDELTNGLGIPLTILEPVPNLPTHIKKLTRKVSRQAYMEKRASIDRIFRTFRKNPLVHILDPADILCGTEYCRTYADDGFTPLYVDDNHLTREGALLIYPVLEHSMD